jgi:hypothetical protein
VQATVVQVVVAELVDLAVMDLLQDFVRMMELTEQVVQELPVT